MDSQPPKSVQRRYPAVTVSFMLTPVVNSRIASTGVGSKLLFRAAHRTIDHMTTDPTLDAIQTERKPSHLESISVGLNCESLSSLDRGGSVTEVRVLMKDRFDADQIARLRRQLTLVGFVVHPAIRGLDQPLSESEAYAYSLCVPPGVDILADRLSSIVSEMDLACRLGVAAQIVDATAAAHRVGLFHGSFSPSTILVDRLGPSPRVHLDFTATSFAKDIPAAVVLDVEHDEACLRDLMRVLLEPDVAPESPPGILNANRRSEIQRLLKPDVQPPPTVAQWGAQLNEFHPDPLEATAASLPSIQGLSADGSSEQATRQTSQLDSNFSFSNLPRKFSAVPDSLGRFELKEKIGQGGMGAVYRAIDQANGQTVALKILNPGGNDVGQAIRRFHKEARLLQDAKNKHVTALIDVGQDQGFHFLAMEFIEGIDLKHWLAGRGPIPETDALQIAADMARALVEAHSRQVVHRDIKPENVLLKLKDDRGSTTADGEKPDLASLAISDYTIKLTDFGIARHVSQTDSLEVTRAGTILGTPRYMSPEQCDARGVGPPADVYSLGITLFQMLTGKVPFDSKDFMEIASMHRFDSPPDIQKRVAEISDATVRIVNRALAKDPAQRYGDAGQMLQELTEVLRGDSSNWQTHPKLPEHDPSRLWEKTVHWKLASQPDELWPLVSNTERLNEAIGLPAVTYRTEKDPKLGLRKFGTFTVSGIKVSWEEHPFEWIEGQRMGVLREYESGPLRWFMSVVTLKPAASGGTELSHQIRMEPRNVLGRVLTKIEADWKGFKNLNRVYLRMDRSIQARRENHPAEPSNRPADPRAVSNSTQHVSGSIDPFADPFAVMKPVSKLSLQRIEQRIDASIGKGAAETAAVRLGEALTHWASQELSHLRPLAMAERLHVNGQEMINACLIAATEGLLNLQWDVLCPTCRVTASSTTALSQIGAHTHCEACDFDFKSNLSDAIELVFRAHPEIRDVNDGQYCIGGPEHSPHVVCQVRLEAGEALELKLDLEPGDYLVRGPRLPGTARIRVQASAAPSAAEFTFSDLGSAHLPKLRMGRQTITLVNNLDTLQLARIERTIPRDDVVTASMATANPWFRKLFPDQKFSSDHPIESETVSFLATAVADIDQLYSQAGDTDAYMIIQRHLQTVSGAIVDAGGTVVKTIGERLLAVFSRREQAADAAVFVRQAIQDASQSEQDPTPPLSIGIGVHCGPTLVTTQNNQLDYFGSSVRAVLSLPDFAGGDTLITESVYNDPAIRSQAWFPQKQVETVDLAGIPGVRVKRIATDQGEY